MKNVILILLLLISAACTAQSQKAPANQKTGIPVFMIDSIRKDKTYFDYLYADDIAAMKVFKNEQYPDGIIYITSKDHDKMFKFLSSPLLSLNDITNANVEKSQRSKPILFIVDDKLLTDTAGIRVPAVRLYKVTVMKATETAYFKNLLPDILLMTILTHPPPSFTKGLTANN